MIRFTRFAPPSDVPILLGVEPRLASWNAAGDRDQLALAQYLDHVEVLLGDRLSEVDGPLAIGLRVGLPESVPLLHHRDLDNYALPLAQRLRSSGHEVVSVQATKCHAEQSFVAASRAAPLNESGEPACVIETNESYIRASFKEKIRDAVSSLGSLPEGPVRLELSFVIGPNRNWTALWKPTIDALGPLLGNDPGTREWNARDGRITELVMHCTVDPSFMWTVVVGVDAAVLLPAPDLDDEAAVIGFALTYNGYTDDRSGDLALLTEVTESAWTATGELPSDVSTLRRVLFFHQRRHRAAEDPRPFGEDPFTAALVAEIRRWSPAGVVRVGGDL